MIRGAIDKPLVDGLMAGSAEDRLLLVGTTNLDAPMPKMRVWVQVNETFQPEPAVTQRTWVSVASRALDTLTSTEELFALTLIKAMVHEAKAEHGVDAEFRMVAIPTDAPKNESGEMFDQDYMRALENLGHRMGTDPTSWTDVIPPAY